MTFDTIENSSITPLKTPPIITLYFILNKRVQVSTKPTIILSTEPAEPNLNNKDSNKETTFNNCEPSRER